MDKTEECCERLLDVMWRDTQEATIGRLSNMAEAQGVSLLMCSRFKNEKRVTDR